MCLCLCVCVCVSGNSFVFKGRDQELKLFVYMDVLFILDIFRCFIFVTVEYQQFHIASNGSAFKILKLKVQKYSKKENTTSI